MSSLVKSHNRSFLRKQESRETKEKTGFPLKNCGNDSNISNVLLLMNSLVTAPIGFSERLGVGFNLLGRKGIFEHFKVCFSDKERRITFQQMKEKQKS